jgi:Zn-dependent peptidase ImmA (M78 family)
MRARGAIAHELSHLLHDPSDAGVQVVLDLEHDRSTHANEQRARAHAAELLLPRTGLQGLLGLPRAVAEHAEALELVRRAMDHFGASWELTANHLCNRGFVDRDLRVWLEAAHAHAPPARPMRLPASGAPSLLLADRTRRAHESALITDGEARAILGMESIDDLPWEADR